MTFCKRKKIYLKTIFKVILAVRCSHLWRSQLKVTFKKNDLYRSIQATSPNLRAHGRSWDVYTVLKHLHIIQTKKQTVCLWRRWMWLWLRWSLSMRLWAVIRISKKPVMLMEADKQQRHSHHHPDSGCFCQQLVLSVQVWRCLLTVTVPACPINKLPNKDKREIWASEVCAV